MSVASLPPLLTVFYLICRVSGLFLVSPLLSHKAISGSIRFGFSLFFAFFFAMALFPQMQSEPAHFPPLLEIALKALLEISIGYLIGFTFNIVLEALVLAGETIDNMIGFSAAQFFDPFSNTFHSMLGQLFVLMGAALLLASDLHHLFIRALAESFRIVPIGHFHSSEGLVDTLIGGTSLIFTYAIKFAAIPMIVLACGLVGVAFTVRVIPDMNVLLTGLPMRILIALYMVVFALEHIQPVIFEAFYQAAALTGAILESLR